jgi:hypothetical protein
MVKELLEIMSDGKFHDIAEICAKHGWRLDSATAAVRSMRQARHGNLIVQRRILDGKTKYCALPREAFKPKPKPEKVEPAVAPEPPPAVRPEPTQAQQDLDTLRIAMRGVVEELFQEFIAGVVDGAKRSISQRYPNLSGAASVRRNDADQGTRDVPSVRTGGQAKQGEAPQG